jgi:hypothetical protein
MGDCADDIISGNQRGGEDDHLEMAFEDAVAHPLVNSQEYNDQWQDAAFDEQQEYAYEESLEEFDEDDED